MKRAIELIRFRRLALVGLGRQSLIGLGGDDNPAISAVAQGMRVTWLRWNFSV
jgi:hypothetical protein